MVEDTSAGARRSVTISTSDPKKHRDVTSAKTSDVETSAEAGGVLGFTSAEILNIQKTYVMYPKLTSKLLAFQLKEAHGIDITPTQIASLKKKKIL